MLAIPYSRNLFGIIPWYSFLIVLGAAAAIFLASKEEIRAGLPKDTVTDFSLIAIPCGIIGARIYYVLFSWDMFRNDFLSVFRIWEGGIAIYGAVIAGMIAAFLFCRKRKISFLSLCDIIAPGLVLAQAVGRWGNYFNQEAYGLRVVRPELCFFPFAVLIGAGDEAQWHMATFFYESVWNFAVFLFLITARRKWFRYRGDVIIFYAFLYACGRLIIEDFRMDSLYASSAVRISQLLSGLIIFAVLAYYTARFGLKNVFRSLLLSVSFVLSVLLDLSVILWTGGLIAVPGETALVRFLLLLLVSAVNIFALLAVYHRNAEGNILYADVKSEEPAV